MRILFMGTSEFAIPALEQLVVHNYDIIGVVTQPDRASGRGKRLSPSPVKEIASANDLKIYQPEKVRDPEICKNTKRIKFRCDRCCSVWTTFTAIGVRYSTVRCHKLASVPST